MTNHYIISALCCIALSAPLTANAAPPTLNKGFYNKASYITSATPTAACSGFGVAVGPGPSGSFYYPGPSATGAVMRFASTQADHVTADKFPKTPAAGATNWSGTIMRGNEPSLALAIPFKAKLTTLDAQSFTAVITVTVTVGAKKCTITENAALTQTG
ncbi:MAG TPA: hypothetical protein VL899_12950 [Alphaproteobacteria bacterium]|nr:hypothetical protein [Alphaproteobacteria bacterium]